MASRAGIGEAVRPNTVKRRLGAVSVLRWPRLLHRNPRQTKISLTTNESSSQDVNCVPESNQRVVSTCIYHPFIHFHTYWGDAALEGHRDKCGTPLHPQDFTCRPPTLPPAPEPRTQGGRLKKTERDKTTVSSPESHFR